MIRVTTTMPILHFGCNSAVAAAPVRMVSRALFVPSSSLCFDKKFDASIAACQRQNQEQRMCWNSHSHPSSCVDLQWRRSQFVASNNCSAIRTIRSRPLTTHVLLVVATSATAASSATPSPTNCKDTNSRIIALEASQMARYCSSSPSPSDGTMPSRSMTTTATTSKQPKERPFVILGVQQIAIGYEMRQPLQKLWIELLGLSPTGASILHRIERENVEEEILQVGPEPFAVEIDLMTPIDPDASPKVHKPPLNHIGLWVDDLPAAVDWLSHQGLRFTPGGIRTGAAGHLVAFIHPKGGGADSEAPLGGNGVLIELVQAPPSIIHAFRDMSAQKGSQT